MNHQKIAEKLVREFVAGRAVYRWPEIERFLKSDRYDTVETAEAIAEFLMEQSRDMRLEDFRKARSKIVRDEDDFAEMIEDLDASIIPVFWDAAKRKNYDTVLYGMESLKEWAKQYGIAI